MDKVLGCHACTWGPGFKPQVNKHKRNMSKRLRIPRSRDQYIINETSIHIGFEKCPQKMLKETKQNKTKFFLNFGDRLTK